MYDGLIFENCYFFVVQRFVFYFILVGSQVIFLNIIQNLKNINFMYMVFFKNWK